jgi:hypothetical protein
MAIVYRSVQTTSSDGGPRAGNVGNALSTRVTDKSKIAEFWSREEAELYENWSATYFNYQSNRNSPYFDYFFSGQDVSVVIEGLTDLDLVLTSFAYNVEQQKLPVYGFASYAYDAMLRGTRIVTGAFSIACDGPISLTRALAKAASVRARAAEGQTGRTIHSVRGLDDDEANIEKYWGRHYDNNIDARQQHIFSIHPPFNFLITYGLQETTLVSNDPTNRANEIRGKYDSNTIMSTDFNERLVRNPTKTDDYQILIENVEIMNKSTQYDTNGTPISEVYTFMARDERLLSESIYTNPPPIRTTNISNTSGGQVEYEGVTPRNPPD